MIINENGKGVVTMMSISKNAKDLIRNNVLKMLDDNNEIYKDLTIGEILDEMIEWVDDNIKQDKQHPMAWEFLTIMEDIRSLLVLNPDECLTDDRENIENAYEYLELLLTLDEK